MPPPQDARAPQLQDAPDLRTLELTSHVLYRDVYLTLRPGSALPADLAERLTIDHKMGLHRRPTDEAFITNIRDIVTRSRNVDNVGEFYIEGLSVCLSVAKLLYRLEHLRDFEWDMKPRLEQRLGNVRLEWMVSMEEEVGAWVLNCREEVKEGLKCGKQQRRRGGGVYD